MEGFLIAFLYFFWLIMKLYILRKVKVKKWDNMN
jgi:hypothetical protein